MKGLQGGISMAMLAAVAQAGVIGGPGGIDTGNTADIPFTSEFSSSVNEDWKDNHAVDADIGGPGPRHGHHWKREEVDQTGDSDIGKSFYQPHTNEQSTSSNTVHNDNHHVDVKEDNVAAPPVRPHHRPHSQPHVAPHHAARGNRDVIGGPSGIDTGNTADIPFTSSFSSDVNEKYKNDHSKDIDAVVHRPHHHWGRDHGDVIGGPEGIDTGNTADIPFTSSFSSDVNEKYTDDHSKDIDAVVHGPHHHWGRDHGEDEFHGDVIGGPDGIDTGNTAAIPFTSSFSSAVDEKYTDNHSKDIDAVVRPHHHWARNHGEDEFDGDVIGGPSGIDTGNTAAIPFTSTFTSSVKEDHQDNHALDLDKDTIVHRPHHWARDHGEDEFHGEVIGGPSGIDTGNTASIPFTSTFSSTVNEKYKDDHSVDTDIHVRPGHGHHWAREDVGHGGDVIGGPSGIDTGNTAAIPFTSTFTSKVDEKYKDDHSIDADIHVRPGHGHHWAREDAGHGGDHDVIGGPSGIDTGNTADIPFTSTFSSAVNEDYKDDHSVDADVHVRPGHHHHWAREDSKHPGVHDVIGGPSGIDTGNTADIPFTSSFTSKVNEDWKDNHSVDADIKGAVVRPHHHWQAREEAGRPEHDVIGGPSGIDTGNTAAIPFTSTFTSEVNEDYKDDHSVNADLKGTVVRPAHHHWVRENAGHEKHPETEVIGGPSGIDTGNTVAIPFTSTFSSEVNEDYKDDHSVEADLKGTVVRPGHHHWPAREETEHHGDHQVIGGPSGIDTGNTADIPFTSIFSSEYSETVQDDHAHKYNVHHRRADDSLISGPSGIDTGNTAFIPFTNTFSQDTNESSKDDHSVTANIDHNIAAPHYAHHEPVPESAPPAHEDPAPPHGAPAAAPVAPAPEDPVPAPVRTHEAPAPTHEAPAPTPEAPASTHDAPAHPAHEAPTEAPAPPSHEAPTQAGAPPSHEAPTHAADPTVHETPAPQTPPHDSHQSGTTPAGQGLENENKNEHGQTSSCSPTVHEVVRTLTHTLSRDSSASTARPEIIATPAHNASAEITEAPMMSSSMYNAPEQAESTPSATGMFNAPAQPTEHASSPSAHEAPGQGADPSSHGQSSGYSTPSGPSSASGHNHVASQSTPAHGAPSNVPESNGSSTGISPNLEQAHHVPGSEDPETESHVLSSAGVASAPAPTDPVDMESIASTITIQEASTFHMIPVYVPAPSATTSQADPSLGRFGDMPSARPTGVDAYQPSVQYNMPLASSTPSSHGMMFTGAGAQIAPANGLFPIVAGVVALLSLIL
ncbi:hypothetical protein BO71DRAFT_83238 [Aspergillus ellipticus CBS 707.79]|uniref:GPI anchored protein n=1 Tax=Aspergillus ellipticus CBS 707.79 TaxID=1448320 RepID=A0A319EGT4_9EURO|nr:hypothetical protein BO71DRAFT_83238 [Aspergillus ellipticus CBS 707.79]